METPKYKATNGVETRSALVVYGSETGNSQDGAEEMGRMLERLHFTVQVLEMDEIETDAMLAHDLILCAISTVGQGDFPLNSRIFWKRLLRKKLGPRYLASAQFAVFGFGDSSYVKYNYAAIKLQKRLLQLGASAITPMGRADEQHPEGNEGTFLPWLVELREQVLNLFPCPEGLEPIPENVLLLPSWLLAEKGSTQSTLTTDTRTVSAAVQRPSSTSISQDVEVFLESNTRATAESHWQDVRHLVFSSTDQLQYGPGDVLIIYPHNPEAHVLELIRLMEWEAVADKKVEFSRIPDKPDSATIKSPSFQTVSTTPAQTLRELLTTHLDIQSVPKRSFFSLISHFTDDEYQKNRLLEFSDPEYLDELWDYTTRPRRSVLEVLQEFDTVKIPWQLAAAVFPLLRGRQFSLASGGALCHGPDSSTRLELLVAIVKYRTVIRKIRRGVCSRYIEGLQAGSTIFATLQKGSLDLTRADIQGPAILVGPGTGVAPIRSLLWQKAAEKVEHNGNCALFFGCRSRNADYFFENEWPGMQNSLRLEVYPAFSRDQEDKHYVQDLIRKQSGRVFEIVYKNNGLVFVCGSSGKMPLAVRQAIKDALMSESSMTEIETEAYLINMEKEKRYKQETW